MRGKRRARGGGGRLYLALVALGVFAVAVRAVYLLDYAERMPTYAQPLVDAKIYSEWSAEIARGDLLSRGEGVFYRAPLYPYLLAAFRLTTGELQPYVAVFQAVLGLATACLAARLAGQWAGPVAALGAFLLLALYGPLYTAESKLLGTTVALFLQVLVLTWGVRVVEGRRARDGLLLGWLLGLAVLVRPFWLVWALALPLALAGASGVRGQPRLWCAFLLGLALCLAPVALRNRIVGEDWVLVSSNGGMTFFQGNNVENRSGLLTIVSRFEMFGSAERQQEVETRVASELAGTPLRPSETSRFWLREGLRFIAQDPGKWIVLEGKKLFRFVSSFEPGDNHSHALERSRLPVLQLLFLPFGAFLALSVFALRRREPLPPAARAALLSAASALAGCLVFFVSSRYRMEGVVGLAILGGVALARWLAPESLGVARAGGWGRGLWARVAVAALVLVVSFLPPGAPARSQESISLAQLGNIHERRGEREEARRAYREAIVLLPENAFAWRNLLQMTVQDSGPAVALARLESAPAVARGNPELRHLRGRFLAALDRREEALVELTRAAEERPLMREAWFYLGRVLQEERRFDEAERAFLEALDTGWPPGELLPQLSFLRIQKGDLEGARRTAEDALRVAPESREAKINLAVASVYLGRLDEAETGLAGLDPEDPLTTYYRGLVALRRGQLEAAWRSLASAATDSPDNRRARYYLELLSIALGRPRGAWPGGGGADDEAGRLLEEWLVWRARELWAGIPREGRGAVLWAELVRHSGGSASAPIREIVRYVQEEDSGTAPQGKP